MTRTEVRGACLCGGVVVTLAEPLANVGVCHCAMCRTWGSGPWMALQSPGATIDGATLEIYRSSSFAERGFCRQCGSHIFHRPRLGDELAVSAGLFISDGYRIDREIFIDAKPPYYRFEADSRKTTSARMILIWLPKMVGRSLAKLLGREP